MSAPMTSGWKGVAAPGSPDALQGFVEARLEAAGVPMKTRMQIAVAVEEIFVDIADCACAPGTGEAAVRAGPSVGPAAVTVTFADRGRPYGPLAKADPDVTPGAEEREIGGLGSSCRKSSWPRCAMDTGTERTF